MSDLAVVNVQATGKGGHQADIQGEFMDYVVGKNSDFTSLYQQDLDVRKVLDEDKNHQIVMAGKEAVISKEEIDIVGE